MAVARQQGQRLVGKGELEQRAVGAGPAAHLDIERVGEADAAARLRRLAGAQVRLHQPVRRRSARPAPRPRRRCALTPNRRALTTWVSLTTSRSPAGAGRQVAERPIDGEAGAAVEQARAGALGCRMLGDQLGRQLEIEIGEGEGRSGKAAAAGIVVGRGRTGRPTGKILPWPPPRPHAVPRPRQRPRRRARERRRRARRRRPRRWKLGLVRDIDLALHLPLRYEDETRLVPIAELRDGSVGQVEGEVVDSKVQFRPRRQLVVTMQDGSADLVLRFLHFYPSQQKTLRARQAAARARRGARRLLRPRDGPSGRSRP